MVKPIRDKPEVRCLLLLIGTALVLLTVTSNASAFSITITVDESGKGLFTNRQEVERFLSSLRARRPLRPHLATLPSGIRRRRLQSSEGGDRSFERCIELRDEFRHQLAVMTQLPTDANRLLHGVRDLVQHVSKNPALAWIGNRRDHKFFDPGCGKQRAVSSQSTQRSSD